MTGICDPLFSTLHGHDQDAIAAELKSDKTRAVWRAALLGEVVGADGE